MTIRRWSHIKSGYSFNYINAVNINFWNFRFQKMSFPVECINEIFKYFENDKTSLRSCLLVNRLWCRTIIPILWGRSFSLIRNSMNSSLGLIEIYLSYLNEEEKHLNNYYPELY